MSSISKASLQERSPIVKQPQGPRALGHVTVDVTFAGRLSEGDFAGYRSSSMGSHALSNPPISNPSLSNPSTALETHRFLQAYCPQVRFGARAPVGDLPPYGPSKQELLGVIDAINGYPHSRFFKGVSAYPQPDTLVWMKEWFSTKFNNIHKDDALGFSAELQKRLVRDRLRYLNFYNLCLGRPPASRDSVRQEVEALSDELSQVLPYVNEQLKNRFKLPERERLLLSSIFAQTAPVLFNMGYNDAIAHSAQVALLSVIQMDRHLDNLLKSAGPTPKLRHQKSMTQEEKVPRLLQAAIMGWLHDVKLDGGLSASNLATHPIVGSALARDLFNQPAIRQELNAMLGNWRSQDPLTTNDFIDGIVQALTVNNDFRFVLDRAILHSPLFLKRSEPGLVEQLQAKGLAPTLIEQFDALAHQRFSAGTEQKIPPRFPVATERLLRESTSFETGLRALDLRQLPEKEVEAYLDQMGQKFSTLDEFIEAWCDGRVAGKPGPDMESRRYNEAIAGLESLIQMASTSPRVSGLSQFAHAEEMPRVSKPLAQILTLSDPLLLSPHKVILTAQKFPTLSQTVENYIEGFQLVVNDTPASYRTHVEWLYRDILVGLLKSAAKFTQNPELFNDYGRYARGHSLADQLVYLKATLTQPRTWNTDHTLDFLPAQEHQARKIIESLSSIIKEDYTEVAWKSQHLFGTEDLEGLLNTEGYGLSSQFQYADAMADEKMKNQQNSAARRKPKRGQGKSHKL